MDPGDSLILIRLHCHQDCSLYWDGLIPGTKPPGPTETKTPALSCYHFHINQSATDRYFIYWLICFVQMFHSVRATKIVSSNYLNYRSRKTVFQIFCFLFPFSFHLNKLNLFVFRTVGRIWSDIWSCHTGHWLVLTIPHKQSLRL